MKLRNSLIIAAFFCLSGIGAIAEDRVQIKEGSSFSAMDTLECGEEADPDAIACLDGLRWKPATFAVRCDPPVLFSGDWLVRFPTAVPSGDAANDLVSMEWYVARDESGKSIKAPAVVVVHESGKGMAAARTIAQGLKGKGLHAFLIHLPGYGARRSAYTADMRNMLPGLKQAVSDVRRARDAVAAIPLVESPEINLQGTSLGGFVVATVAGLDRGYSKTFILLAGGQVSKVILNGTRDAAALKKHLSMAGVTTQQIHDLTQVIEPMRLAHRVDPERTWVFSGKFDEVVPPDCTHAFVKAAKLDYAHHIILPVGHYTAALMLPVIMPRLAELMLGKAAAAK